MKIKKWFGVAVFVIVVGLVFAVCGNLEKKVDNVIIIKIVIVNCSGFEEKCWDKI